MRLGISEMRFGFAHIGLHVLLLLVVVGIHGALMFLVTVLMLRIISSIRIIATISNWLGAPLIIIVVVLIRLHLLLHCLRLQFGHALIVR